MASDLREAVAELYQEVRELREHCQHLLDANNLELARRASCHGPQGSVRAQRLLSTFRHEIRLD